MEEAMLKGLMDKFNADFSQLEIVNIGASDFFTSVERDVDFVWIFYGWTGIHSEIIEFPIDFMLLQDVDPVLDFYTPLIIASESMIQDDPGLIRDFLEATRMGYEFAIKNPEEAGEIFSAENDEIDPEIITASQKYLSENYVSYDEGWGFMKEEIWDNFSSWMYDKGLLEGKLNTGKAFTNEFLEK
jgi:ABC-type nitrate/sulfonate/bicarbonate transport system substrate-binding protein